MREEENRSKKMEGDEKEGKGDEAKRKSKEEGDEHGQGVDGTKDVQQVLALDASSHKKNPSAQQSNETCSDSNDRLGLKNFKNQHCKMRFNFYSDTFDCFLPRYIQRDTSKR